MTLLLLVGSQLGPSLGPNVGGSKWVQMATWVQIWVQMGSKKSLIWVKMGSKKSLIWGESGVSKPESGTFWASQMLKVVRKPYLGLIWALKSWKWDFLSFSKWSKSLDWGKTGLKIVNFWAWGNSGCCWHVSNLGEIWLWEGGKVGFWA